MKTKNKRNYLKQNGITLIALVVTIVVLLILAGVTINALFGDTGIIKSAQDAQNKMDQAQDSDLTSLNNLNNWIENQTRDTEKVPDILERYILGEDKKGILATNIVDISNVPTNLKFINNDIIPNAETELEFSSYEVNEQDIEITFKYQDNYYIATADATTRITKTITKISLIFSGKIKVENEMTLEGIVINLAKKYTVVYTEDGEEKRTSTTTGWIWPVIASKIQIDENCAIAFFNNHIYTLNLPNKEIIINQIYEIGNVDNCVEENGFTAFFQNDNWNLCYSPNTEYIVPKTVNGKSIDEIWIDFISGTPIFAEPITIGCTGDVISIEKIIVTTPDVSFIFELEKFECLSLKELDLSACGDNIEISTTFTEKYADVKIYVSPTVKAKYPSNDNIIAK